MYFIIDVIAIAFILVLSLLGLKLGFFKSTIDVVLVLVFFAAAAGGAYLTVAFLFEPEFGWVTELQSIITPMLGNSKISGGQEIIETVAYWIGLAALTLITFIFYLIICNLIRKFIIKISECVNKLVLFAFIDKLLGFAVNLAASAGIVIALMAVVHSLAPLGILTYFNEVFLASEVLSLFYEINPLNELLAPMFSGLPAILPA
jgi:uncharacterized membrane protein required for colicin V production